MRIRMTSIMMKRVFKRLRENEGGGRGWERGREREKGERGGGIDREEIVFDKEEFDVSPTSPYKSVPKL